MEIIKIIGIGLTAVIIIIILNPSLKRGVFLILTVQVALCFVLGNYLQVH